MQTELLPESADRHYYLEVHAKRPPPWDAGYQQEPA